MSSPVHHPQDLDEALMYAPPWARKAGSMPVEGEDRPDRPPPWRPNDAAAEPTFIGDLEMARLRRRLSLDPEAVPEPPMPIDGWLSPVQVALRLAAVAGVAALVAWVVISLANKPAADDVAQSAANDVVQTAPNDVVQTAANDAQSVANVVAQSASPPAQAAIPVKLVHVSVATETPPTAAIPSPPADPTALVAKVEPAPTTGPWPAEKQPPPAAQEPSTTTTLSPDEIAVLIKRGKDFLANGDVSSARLLLRRAAEAGNAEAALALGSTFDPRVIGRLGAIGVQTDPGMARQWYQKAAQLGSDVAVQRLATFARADQ
jgi:hypothetical protein